MRSRFLLLSLIVLLIPALVVSAGGPSIKLDKESHDYGRVLAGQTVSEEFSVTNVGDQKLVIENLRASCGCTKAIKGSSEIPPNGKTTIVAAFDSSGLPAGRKQKTLSVETNDPQHPTIKISLYAEVVRELTLDPPSLAKNLPEFAETVSFPVKIQNASDKPYHVTGAKGETPGVSVNLRPARFTVEPHATVPFSLEMKLKPESGRFFYMGRLQVETDHPLEKDLDLRYLVKLEKTQK